MIKSSEKLTKTRETIFNEEASKQKTAKSERKYNSNLTIFYCGD